MSQKLIPVNRIDEYLELEDKLVKLEAHLETFNAISATVCVLESRSKRATIKLTDGIRALILEDYRTGIDSVKEQMKTLCVVVV